MGYTYFGAMLDCSRNAVLSVAEVKKYIRYLAKMGYNALELYTEDTYEVEGEPYFGYLRGGYSIAEIREIDAYAKTQGIELIPCIQTLAHFTNLAYVPEYTDIIDLQDILLVDEPKTYELIEKMIASVAKAFTSRKINIGMDEAGRLGLGKYLQKHGFCNRFDLLMKHLRKVLEILDKYGFQAHMWSDMFFNLLKKEEYQTSDGSVPQELKEKIPDNVSLTFWAYYTSKFDFYDEMMKTHAKLCKDPWFAGGAITWYGFAPMNAYSLNALRASMESAIKNNVKNILITVWGDNGAECSRYSVLPTLFAAKKFADGCFDMALIKTEFKALFGFEFDDFMLLDIPNKSESNPDCLLPYNACKSLLYNDCFLGVLDNAVSEQAHIPFDEYANQLEEAKMRVGEFAYIYETLVALCRLLHVKTEIGIRARESYRSKDSNALREVAEDLEKCVHLLDIFRNKFYTQWIKENKIFGWEVQDIRLGGVRARMQKCLERLNDYLSGKILQIEELEKDILPFGKKQTLGVNSYSLMASVHRIG